MIDLCALNLEELKNHLLSMGEKAYRAKQIFEWIYAKGAMDFEKMSNLSLALREKLQQSFHLNTLQLMRSRESEDGQTVKFLFKMSDGAFIESVLILSGSRKTICVSSQVGCPARCAFCASGKKGFFRNLSSGEIIQQARHVNDYLKKKGQSSLSHVVFMGMGEPLLNYEELMRAIFLLTDPQAFGISQRRITVSTVGIPEAILSFAKADLKVSLVFSLHAPNQNIRKKIIPFARKYALEDILKAMDVYSSSTKRDITYEYILIDGINSEKEHARELSQLLADYQCTVNLIPYNPVEGVNLKKPPIWKIQQFRRELNAHRIINTCRYTKGDDIAAACGQLALQEQNKLIA